MSNFLRSCSLIVLSAACVFNSNLSWGHTALKESATNVNVQDEDSKEEAKVEKKATIKGKIVAEEGLTVEVDLPTLPVGIVEQVEYTPLPLPQDWGSKTDEQRQAWIKEFQESDKGKAFLAKREEEYKNQHRFELEIQADGSFELFDVPPGKYNLFGRKDVEVDAKKYAIEVFGEFEVGEVDELKLEPLPVSVTRLLAAGETAPAFEVDELTRGVEKITLAQFSSRPILVHFWTSSNPAAKADAPVLKGLYEALHEELKLELISICVDQEPKEEKKAIELVAAQQLTWPQGRTGGWSHPVFAAYGLRSIPTYYLIGADGKILLSNVDFFRAFMEPNHDLIKLVRDKVTGVAAEPTK